MKTQTKIEKMMNKFKNGSWSGRCTSCRKKINISSFCSKECLENYVKCIIELKEKLGIK